MKKDNIHALRQKDVDLTAKLKALHQTSVDEGRKFSEEEQKSWNEMHAQREMVRGQIKQEESFLEDERHTPGSALAPTPGVAVVDNKKGPFKSLGEQMVAIAAAARSEGRSTDPRLLKVHEMQAAASGASETVPSDGGFAVQLDFQETILQRMYSDGEILDRVDTIPIGPNANGVKINAVDEDSRVDGSRWGGLQAFWVNEADPYTASKAKYRQIELRLNKLTGLSYVTDELIADAGALTAFLMNAVPRELRFKVEDAIFSGTGSGMPLGFLNSGAVIQVAKDSGDSTATVSTPDILNMWSRLFARSRANATWFINQDVEPKLYPLTLGSGTAVQLLYFPPGMNGNAGPYGRMLGLPVIPVEHAATLGTPGDIVLADLSQYIFADKGAPQFAQSLHVKFLTGENTFRWTYRCDGQPTWKKPLTPKNGSNTQSAFVSLATRP